jgi:hypothetical protein
VQAQNRYRTVPLLRHEFSDGRAWRKLAAYLVLRTRRRKPLKLETFAVYADHIHGTTQFLRSSVPDPGSGAFLTRGSEPGVSFFQISDLTYILEEL